MKKKTIVLIILALVAIGIIRTIINTAEEKPKPRTRRPTDVLLIYPKREPSATPYKSDFWITLTAFYAPKSTPEAPSYHKPVNLQAPTQNSGECIRIKGNVSSNGKIYHCPTWRDYNKVEMHSSEGDRYFCSEAEAKAAGFREPEYTHGPCR